MLASTTVGGTLGVTGSTTLSDLNVTGSVGIGTTTPAEKLQVWGDVRIGAGGTLGCINAADGTRIAGSCSSDVRFKKDIQPIPKVLDRLTEMEVVNYKWRVEEYPEKHFGRSSQTGLIAQEVEILMPELVGEDEAGYKTVNYSKLSLMLLQGIRELKEKTDTEIENLKEVIKELQEKIE